MSVATITELWRMSATELADAISSNQVSSREVVEAHLRRIDEVNPSINAITVLLAEQALDAAKAADRITTKRGELPRFHGVSVTIKENIDLVGTPTTQGTKSLAQAYPSVDAPDVERLRAAWRLRRIMSALRAVDRKGAVLERRGEASGPLA
jgi:amidase